MDETLVRERSESLDPQDWSGFRHFAHRLLDDAIDYSNRIREQPVWRGVPDAVKRELQRTAPEAGENPERVYEDFRNLVLPYVYANTHPRAWGWVIGAGTAQGIAHQIWASALNSNVFGAEQSPDYIEEQVLNWFKEKMGYPQESSGVLVSGTSMATLTALAIARTAILGKEILSGGLQKQPKPLALYCSREAHLSIEKSVAVLGMGTNSLRKIAVNEKFRIVIPELLASISEDRKNGYVPLCVVGNAGTVNTGATDDLEQLAAICERERLWFHVDGAFGALLKLSPSLSSIVTGLEKADSVAFDLHKWMHIPYDAACMLTRHPEHHRATFSSTGAYIERHQRGIATGIPYIGLGIETSRPFRALKVWWALRENGFQTYARTIERNVEQARFLADLINRNPQFCLLSAELNIVCFQFAPTGLLEPAISDLNRELLHRLHETGIAVPSYTELNGRFAIRAAITNHRTTDDDIKILLREIARIGSEVAIIRGDEIDRRS